MMRRREFLRAALSSGAFSLAGQKMAWPAPLIASEAAPTRKNLYTLGQFEQNDASKLEAVTAALASSSFNVITLAFLTIDTSQGKLQLLYNGHPFAAFSRRVPEMLQHLRTDSSIPRKVLLSIGGWQSAVTFEKIRSAGVPAFIQQLTQEAIEPLNLNGIDLDLEPMQGGLDQWLATHREYSATLVALTNEYKRVHPTHVVSHAPIAPVAAEFYARDTIIDGVGKSLLVGTRALHGNNVDWLNIQFYEGGAIESGDIAGYYKDSLAAPLLQLRATTGIALPLHFLQPLFQPNAKPPQKLAFCEQTLRDIDTACGSLHAGRLNGVSLWDYRQVLPDISGWSKGLDQALATRTG